MDDMGIEMATASIFDFITDTDFRSSLESDYRELNVCMEAGAWKAVLVLAGSIVEAVLVDYLASVGYEPNNKTVLEMVLAEAIPACKARGILTDKTANLSDGIRMYRNLIHPGRCKRLSESADRTSARIAQPLVEKIIDEVRLQKQKTYGYTAEQLLGKLQIDPTAMAILDHLLKEVHDTERARLLLDVIPKAHFQLADDPLATLGAGENPHFSNLRACYRRIFGLVDEEVRKEATKAFVSIIKDETEQKVREHGRAFFLAKDLIYLSEPEQSLVKEHVFSRLRQSELPTADLRVAQGLGCFLCPNEVTYWIKNMLPKLLQSPVGHPGIADRAHIEAYIMDEYWTMKAECQSIVVEHIDKMIRFYQMRGADRTYKDRHSVLQRIRANLEHGFDPFADA